MTSQELNDLIARGAAQPGVRDVEELMRIGQELSQQARELVELYGSVLIATASTNSGLVSSPAVADHAHMG